MRENNMFSLSTKVLVRLHVAIITPLLAIGFGFPAGTAETPSDTKRTAFETIERNAEQIATVGDVLYYFGEPGMQEHELKVFKRDPGRCRLQG
jgi:hypothetical protein